MDERFAIVAGRFNEPVVSRLVDGAVAYFERENIEFELTWVPGAFELPLTAKIVAETGLYAAVVCLGAVIRGETSHYDLVANEAARGILDVGLATGLPVVFGVVTTETVEQAMDRAGGKHGNKGWDAAAAAAAMAKVVREVRRA